MGRRLGSPTPSPTKTAAAQRYALRPGEGTPRKIYSHRSGAWNVAATLPTRTTMTVDFLGSAHDEEVATRCQVVIEGAGEDATLVSSLVASDSVGTARLEPELLLGEANAPEITITLTMAAHLVATSSRLRNVWPTTRPVPISDVYDAIDVAMPPHASVFGGTGLGKTTFLEHLIDHSFAANNTVVVFCPHGDLAARTAALARRRDIDADIYDFSHDIPPTLNLCETPAGFTPQEWSGEMVHLIRNMWPDAQEDWFGPVLRRAIRSALRVLVEDPAGPHRIGKLPDVLRNPKEWLDAAERIGDPEVITALNETARAISRASEANFGPWIFAKLEPIVGNIAMANIVDRGETTVAADAVAAGRSMIVSVPTAALGDEGATLLTSMLLTQIWRNLRKRPADADRPIDIFIDEAHRMPRALIAEIFAEARKFGVRLRIATQSPFNSIRGCETQCCRTVEPSPRSGRLPRPRSSSTSSTPACSPRRSLASNDTSSPSRTAPPTKWP